MVGRAVEVGLLDGRLAAELLLQPADQVRQLAALGPLEERLVVYFAGVGANERVLDPLGDVDDGALLGEVAEEDAECWRAYILRGRLVLGLTMRER